MEAALQAGSEFIVHGTVKMFMSRPEIVHPEITWSVSGDASETFNVGRVIPVYVEIEGIPTAHLRKILWEALEKYGSLITEDLPERYLKQARASRDSRRPSAKIHFPPRRRRSAFKTSSISIRPRTGG